MTLKFSLSTPFLEGCHKGLSNRCGGVFGRLNKPWPRGRKNPRPTLLIGLQFLLVVADKLNMRETFKAQNVRIKMKVDSKNKLSAFKNLFTLRELFANGFDRGIVKTPTYLFLQVFRGVLRFFNRHVKNLFFSGSLVSKMGWVSALIVFKSLDLGLAGHEYPLKGLNYKVTGAMANFCEKELVGSVVVGGVEIPCHDFRPRIQLLKLRSRK